MDGAGTEGGYTYNNNEDFGDSTYYGGPGDDVFFNPSQQDHQQQLMDFGEEGADEEKAGDARLSSSAHSSRQHQMLQQPRAPYHQQKQHQQLARNAVSDLVSNTFSKSAAELDNSRSSREASGGSSSGNSSSRHTRTEQFMDILDDEFRANKVRTNSCLVCLFVCLSL